MFKDRRSADAIYEKLQKGPCMHSLTLSWLKVVLLIETGLLVYIIRNICCQTDVSPPSSQSVEKKDVSILFNIKIYQLQHQNLNIFRKQVKREGFSQTLWK